MLSWGKFDFYGSLYGSLENAFTTIVNLKMLRDADGHTKSLCKHLYTVKTLNIEHLQVLKNLSFIYSFPLLGGNLKKIVTFGAKHFVRYSRHACYLGCPLLGCFTVYYFANQKLYSI